MPIAPADVVARLMRAENECNATLADAHLSEAFLGITRSAGFEEDRAQILRTIAHPRNPDLVRHLHVDQAWTDGDLAVVRSLVTTEHAAQPGVTTGYYRNCHVLRREGDAWRCLHWQATRLDTAP